MESGHHHERSGSYHRAPAGIPPAPAASKPAALQTSDQLTQQVEDNSASGEKVRRSLTQKCKDFGLPGFSVAGITLFFSMLSIRTAAAAEQTGSSTLVLLATGTTLGVVAALGKYISAAEYGDRWIRRRDVMTAVGESAVGAMIGLTATGGLLNVYSRFAGAGSTESAIYGGIIALGSMYCGARIFLSNPIPQLLGRRRPKEE